MPDFAHTPGAEASRARKAAALASQARHAGVLPEELRVALLPDSGRAGKVIRTTLLKLAGASGASEETWGIALKLLTDWPPVIVEPDARDRPAPCGCIPDPITGILYEDLPRPDAPYGYDGWTCPHSARINALVCSRGGKAPDARAVAAIQEMGAILEDNPPVPIAEDLASGPVPEGSATELIDAEVDARRWWD